MRRAMAKRSSPGWLMAFFTAQASEHVHAPRLKELLAEHVRGFREVFGGAGMKIPEIV